MEFESSDEEPMHSALPMASPKRSQSVMETDEEDVSSTGSMDSDLEPVQQVNWNNAVRNARAMVQNTHAPLGRRRVLRRQRYTTTGRARADDFVATMRLLSEVEALRRQRDELMSLQHARVLNTGSRDALVNTTIEYFDTFRDGFCGPRLPEMIRFFNTRLDQEVFAYGGGNLGLDTWIEQWQRYTHMFPSISMRLKSMNVMDLADATPSSSSIPSDDPTIATCIIETKGVLDGRITRQAVCTMFPHLRHREDLIHKLVGRPLNLPITLRFYYNAVGRVIRYDFDGDYFQAFSNFEDVGLLELTQIMEHVAIGENTTVPAPVELGDDEFVPQYPHH